MTDDAIRTRYPRLIRAMQWVACLSGGEAVACIRDYKEGRRYSCEAVDHFGGTTTCIERASKARARHMALYVHQQRCAACFLMGWSHNQYPVHYRRLGG